MNAIGYVSSPELKTAWEQTFGIHLKEPGTEGSDDLPLLTELDLAAHASNVSREKTVILGELEPKQIIDRIVGEMGIHHFVHARNKHAAPYVRTTLRKLSGDFAWGLEPYLWPAAPITTKFVQKSSQKTAVIQELTQWASTLKCFSGLTEILGTIADELLMNAIYDAPRDLFGEAKYNHLSRTDEVVLEAKEQVKFRWGADPETVGLSIEDTFGALNLETAVASIQRSYAEGPKRATSGGAGMGIYMIYENSHCFVINSQPGKRTEVIALVSLGRSYEEYQRGGRCFSFFKV